MTATDLHHADRRRTEIDRSIEAVWRIESAKLIAGLTRMVRDVGVAEDLAQEALVAALEQWPESGVPDNPGAWLMATARARSCRSSTPVRRPRRKSSPTTSPRAAAPALRARKDVL